MLHHQRYPAFILYFTIEPPAIDVNVHPTKHELRFRESRLVHDFLFAKIHHALAQTKPQAVVNVNTAASNEAIIDTPGKPGVLRQQSCQLLQIEPDSQIKFNLT